MTSGEWPGSPERAEESVGRRIGLGAGARVERAGDPPALVGREVLVPGQRREVLEELGGNLDARGRDGVEVLAADLEEPAAIPLANRGGRGRAAELVEAGEDQRGEGLGHAVGEGRAGVHQGLHGFGRHP